MFMVLRVVIQFEHIFVTCLVKLQASSFKRWNNLRRELPRDHGVGDPRTGFKLTFAEVPVTD